MKNQYQLNMRTIHSISTQTLYLNKNIDQVKGSRCTLITWDHDKVFTWKWCVTVFPHFCFLGYIHSWDVLVVIKSTMLIVNIYLTLHFYLSKSWHFDSLDKCGWWGCKCFDILFLIGHKSIGQFLHMD